MKMMLLHFYHLLGLQTQALEAQLAEHNSSWLPWPLCLLNAYCVSCPMLEVVDTLRKIKLGPCPQGSLSLPWNIE